MPLEDIHPYLPLEVQRSFPFFLEFDEYFSSDEEVFAETVQHFHDAALFAKIGPTNADSLDLSDITRAAYLNDLSKGRCIPKERLSKSLRIENRFIARKPTMQKSTVRRIKSKPNSTKQVLNPVKFTQTQQKQ
jgi:hypothetical protein